MNLCFFFFCKNQHVRLISYRIRRDFDKSLNDPICFQKECEDSYKDRVSYDYLFWEMCCQFHVLCPRSPFLPLPILFLKRSITCITLILLLFTITIITAYSLIAATRLSCQLYCCYHTVYPCAAISFLCSFFFIHLLPTSMKQ